MSSRTEPASPRKLNRARELGDTPTSPQLSQALVLCATACVLPLGITAFAIQCAQQLRASIGTRSLESSALQAGATTALTAVAAFSLPPLVIAAIARIAVGVIETRTGGTSSTQGSKRSHSSTIRSPLSLQAISNTVASWLIAVAVVIYSFTWVRHHAAIATLTLGHLSSAIRVLQTATLRLLWASCVIWLIVGALSFAWAYRLWIWRNRMSRAEKKQERREAEGDPSIAVERRRLSHAHWLESAELRMQDAALVIHHATRVAVVLKYDSSSFEPPRLIGIVRSKRLAFILDEAHHLGVPIVEQPSLTRLLAQGAVGEPITEHNYAAVAELLLGALRVSGPR